MSKTWNVKPHLLAGLTPAERARRVERYVDLHDYHINRARELRAEGKITGANSHQRRADRMADERFN